VSVLLAGQAAAQEQSSPRWDVTQARGNTRQIDFTTTEGTEISVDATADGRWVVFDLLAHIYRVPTTGGAAEALTQNSGVALNYHPRVSPDGKLIAFVSDREGQNNIWVMNSDGSGARALFRDPNVRVTTPTWTPDGQYILVRRQGMGGAGGGGEQGASGIWMFHKDGGEGVRLINDANAQWPSVSPDGKYVYYQVRIGEESDPVGGHYQIRRFELANGKMIDITAGVGRRGCRSHIERWCICAGDFAGRPLARVRAADTRRNDQLPRAPLRPAHGALAERSRYGRRAHVDGSHLPHNRERRVAHSAGLRLGARWQVDCALAGRPDPSC
jgi:Tol biopolymer transport system component